MTCNLLILEVRSGFERIQKFNLIYFMRKKIKSKFPATRIKRIMRIDEEVGKVAQVTPFLIGKGLELFLAEILQACLKQTQAKGAKKVTSLHLKTAIETTLQFDFLKDLVKDLPDIGL
jgi:ERCC4-related helicase